MESQFPHQQFPGVPEAQRLAHTQDNHDKIIKLRGLWWQTLLRSSDADGQPAVNPRTASAAVYRSVESESDIAELGIALVETFFDPASGTIYPQRTTIPVTRVQEGSDSIEPCPGFCMEDARLVRDMASDLQYLIDTNQAPHLSQDYLSIEPARNTSGA